MKRLLAWPIVILQWSVGLYTIGVLVLTAVALLPAFIVGKGLIALHLRRLK